MKTPQFRVWDKTSKQFTQNWCLSTVVVETRCHLYHASWKPDCFGHGNYGNSLESDDSYSSLTDNLVMQQFTGLKDKNGVKIFEGDIVQFSPWGSPKKQLEEYLCGSLKKIGFGLDYGQFPMAGFVAISLSPSDLEEGHPLNIMDQRNMLVIGNIFENQELLK